MYTLTYRQTISSCSCIRGGKVLTTSFFHQVGGKHNFGPYTPTFKPLICLCISCTLLTCPVTLTNKTVDREIVGKNWDLKNHLFLCVLVPFTSPFLFTPFYGFSLSKSWQLFLCIPVCFPQNQWKTTPQARSA